MMYVNIIFTCFLSSLLAARVDICFPYQYKFYLAYDKVRYYFVNSCYYNYTFCS